MTPPREKEKPKETLTPYIEAVIEDPMDVLSLFQYLNINNVIIGTPYFGGENDWGVTTPAEFIEMVVRNPGAPHPTRTFEHLPHDPKASYSKDKGLILSEYGFFVNPHNPVLETSHGLMSMEDITYQANKDTFRLRFLPAIKFNE